MSLNIVGDRNLFVSKNAIIRFKNDIKTINYTEIDDDKYLKPGYIFKFVNGFNMIENNTVNIITEEEYKNDNKKMELKQKLKKILNNTKDIRSNAGKQKLESLKRSVPKKLFESYVGLMKKYNLDNVPAPDDVINNIDKYRLQISTIMGKKEPLSNDMNMSNHIRSYYNVLGKFLDIEPLVQGNNMQYSSNPSPRIIQEPIEDDDMIPNLV